MMTKKKEMGLYVHIPFCVKKCNYCDFLSFPATEEEMERYNNALVNELKVSGKKYRNYQVKTIFIGGGTPSILPSKMMGKLLKSIIKYFNLENMEEFTIECNPGTLDKDKINLYKKHRVNRISLGLQSTEPAELEKLGRIHGFDEFLESYTMLRESGFNNINVDLMSALPGQSIKDWEKTLLTVATLGPEHISAYSLIIEEGTPFFEKYNIKDLPDEEEDRLMYSRTREILEEMGYSRYEISNYAKKGFESRHNSIYWTRGNYLGVGLGASSLIENKRFSNTKNMEEYVSGSYKLDKMLVDITILTQDEQMEEFMFLGLRMMEGISKDRFEKEFNMKYNDVYGEITRKLVIEGFIVENEDRIFLTDKGIDVSNLVLSHFMKN